MVKRLYVCVYLFPSQGSAGGHVSWLTGMVVEAFTPQKLANARPTRA